MMAIPLIIQSESCMFCWIKCSVSGYQQLPVTSHLFILVLIYKNQVIMVPIDPDDSLDRVQDGIHFHSNLQACIFSCHCLILDSETWHSALLTYCSDLLAKIWSQII